MTRVVLDPNRCGIGDVVVASWIGEGANRAGHELAFVPSQYDGLVRMMGQAIAAPGEEGIQIATYPGSLYCTELLLRGERPVRALGWQERMPFKVTPARPFLNIPVEFRAWASLQEFQCGENVPLALIFPGCCFQSRRWATHKYLRVAAALEAAGWAVIAVDSGDAIVKHFPHSVHGQPLEHICALMRVADCVIGNDSGPCHLAGTIGTKSFAIMGPTDPRVIFGHCPEVETLRVGTDECACVGCHFEGEKGYTEACGVGCEALSLLPWRRVAERVDRWHRLGESATVGA